ncbi:MAG: TonB-dependent hemoglobin/transferrin/lactoferrin family receptor [Gammaproteobacteria bacterium]
MHQILIGDFDALPEPDFAGLRTFTLAFCVAMTPAMVCPAAQAAEPSSADIELVTVTATRTKTALFDAPATVSVLTSDTIEKQLAKDIKDLVRFEPGVSVRSSPSRFTAAGASTGRDGNSGFNIRGLEGNRVLIQVDGVRAPDSYSFGAQSVGRGDYVDLDIVKSVEIVRGPASALYGSDGLAGAVSFITKDPSDLLTDGQPWSVKARAGYASADDTRSESVVAAARSGQWESLIAYTRRDGKGQETRGDNNVANVDRTTPNPEDNSSNAVLAKLIYSLSDSQRLRFTIDHLDRDIDWDVLSAIAKPPLTATSTLGLTAFDEMKRDRLTLDHQYDNPGGAIDAIRTNIYWQQGRTRQYSSEDRNTAADRIRDSRFDNTVRGASVELTSDIGGDAIKQRFVYGADYSTTLQEGVRDGTVPPAGETFPTHAFPTTDYRLAGVFLQDEITFASGKVSLYPALRWDYFELEPRNDPLFVSGVASQQSDSHVTPKLGLLVRITDRVNVFANAAEGFKAPAPSQVNNGFTNPTMFYRSLSNPDLDPETSRTFEVGVRMHGGRWTGSLAGFTGRYDDFIEQIQVSGSFSPTDPAVYQYVNLSGVKIRGIEGRTELELIAGLTFTASASYSHGNSEVNGVQTPLTSVDPLKWVTGLDWNAPGRRYGTQLVAVHSQGKSASRAGITCTGGCFLPDSFTVFDALAWWKATDRLSLRAGVFNLTDEKYFWWGDTRGVASSAAFRDAFSQPGRNASVSLSLQF